MTESQSRLAIGLAAIVAIAYDIFFWREGLGNNWLWFGTLFLAVATGVLVMAKRWHNGWAVIPALAALGFAGSVALYENEFATFLAPALSVLAGLGYIGLVGFWAGMSWHIRNFAFFEHFETIFTGWRVALHNATHGREGLLRQIGFGLLIAAPFIIIFALLFSSADAIFADWLKRLSIWEYGWRAIRTLILITLGVGFAAALTRGNGSGEVRVWTWKMPVATVSVVLGLLNLLFAAFVAIQIKYYFWTGATVSVVESARSGFFDLARVLVLAAIIIVAIYRSYASIARSWVVTILQTLFVAQVAVVAVSALRRMSLYQADYGFTTLRLYVEWFIYFTLALAVLAVVALIARISFRRFAGAVLALGALAGVIVSWINVDAVIARENIARWETENKDLDTDYLAKLSLDAVPVVGELLKSDAAARLTPAQVLDVQRYWEKTNRQVASTTPLSYTWSALQAKMTFAELNAVAEQRFGMVKTVEEKYQKFVMPASKAMYDDCPRDILSDGWEKFGPPTRVNTITCTTSAEPNVYSFLVLTTEKDKPLSSASEFDNPAKYKYVYYVAQGDSQKITRVLYSRVLKEGESLSWRAIGMDENQERPYTLLVNGTVIYKDVANRRYYAQNLQRGGTPVDPTFSLTEPIQL